MFLKVHAHLRSFHLAKEIQGRNEISVPPINFTNVIHMKSVDLQKVFRDMNTLGEKLNVEITSSGSATTLATASDLSGATVTSWTAKLILQLC